MPNLVKGSNAQNVNNDGKFSWNKSGDKEENKDLYCNQLKIHQAFWPQMMELPAFFKGSDDKSIPRRTFKWGGYRRDRQIWLQYTFSLAGMLPHQSSCFTALGGSKCYQSLNGFSEPYYCLVNKMLANIDSRRVLRREENRRGQRRVNTENRLNSLMIPKRYLHLYFINSSSIITYTFCFNDGRSSIFIPSTFTGSR